MGDFNIHPHILHKRKQIQGKMYSIQVTKDVQGGYLGTLTHIVRTNANDIFCSSYFHAFSYSFYLAVVHQQPPTGITIRINIRQNASSWNNMDISRKLLFFHKRTEEGRTQPTRFLLSRSDS